MSTSSPYRHKLHNSSEYRVVCVSAGRWNDPIRCMLVHRRLEDTPGELPYKALSYVWGSASVTDTIDLEDSPFQITLNLSCALRHLRKDDAETYLWVDALCINQQDHRERSLQVGIMKLIYQNSEEVVVFMGDGRGHRVNRSHLKEPLIPPMINLHGNDRDKSLAAFLRTFRSAGPRESGSSLTGAAAAMGFIALFSDQDTVEEACMELMKLSEKKRCHLFELFRAFVTCPWWSRIWVVQEIAVGTVVTIQYGTITLPWEDLVATANVWLLPRTREVATNAGIEPENLKVFALFANQLTGLEQTRRQWHADNGTDLVRLLQEFSDRKASDDRDKVYGLLSLAKQDQEYIQPNYELDVFQTYRATALALIGRGESLACWAGDQKRKFNKGLPSWIPDWSTAIDTGDKHRLDLFDKYSMNRGWTLRFIYSEQEYWHTVEDQLNLLINSPAGQSGRLPASLRAYVLDYTQALKGRASSLLPFRTDGNELKRTAMDCLAWSQAQGSTQSLAFAQRWLRWCEDEGTFPNSSKSPLRRWILIIAEWQMLQTRLEQAVSQTECSILQTSIHQSLRSLYDTNREKRFDLGDRWWERAMDKFGDIAGGVEIRRAIERVIYQCSRLSSLCSKLATIWTILVRTVQHLSSWRPRTTHFGLADEETEATDNAISPSSLFKVSYSLRGRASWLTAYQSERDALKDWSIEAALYAMDAIPENILTIQMVLVDIAAICCLRQFGWTDTKSSLVTLVSWLCLSNPVMARGMAQSRELRLDHGRIRQFAKTIVGGMCRRGGSYQEIDDETLGPLEDWLRQSLVAEEESSDRNTDGFACSTLDDWFRNLDRAIAEPGQRGGARDAYHEVALREKSLQKLMANREFAVPPSPFFEDIKVATDGRVFFLTDNGSMGLGPASMRNGDTIHVLPSGRVHFVLRTEYAGLRHLDSKASRFIEWLKRGKYELIGDCYLHTGATINDRTSTDQEPAVEGSLPFEVLGTKYWKETELAGRETIRLV